MRILWLTTPILLTMCFAADAQEGPAHAVPAAPQTPAAANLLEVKRIFVAQLTGGIQADALRELIIVELKPGPPKRP